MVQSKTNTATLILVIILLIAVLVGGGILAYFYFNPMSSNGGGNVNTISNFEECAAAGYPIIESYPRQCRANGINFIEQIDDDRRYVSRSQSQCALINFRCNAGEEAFFDNTGCGCQEISQQTIYCTPEMRNVEACTAIYQPVCGWFDPDEVQCIRYPCATTYSNACDACGNDDVLYYTVGECPE